MSIYLILVVLTIDVTHWVRNRHREKINKIWKIEEKVGKIWEKKISFLEIIQSFVHVPKWQNETIFHGRGEYFIFEYKLTILLVDYSLSS